MVPHGSLYQRRTKEIPRHQPLLGLCPLFRLPALARAAAHERRAWPARAGSHHPRHNQGLSDVLPLVDCVSPEGSHRLWGSVSSLKHRCLRRLHEPTRSSFFSTSKLLIMGLDRRALKSNRPSEEPLGAKREAQFRLMAQNGHVRSTPIASSSAAGDPAQAVQPPLDGGDSEPTHR